MVVEGLDDPEGDLLESVRGLIGRKPLVASLDFHANVTARIAKHADIIVGYNSFPHTNLFEVGQKAAELACRHHARTGDLRRVFIKIPMIVPMERVTIVGNEPMVRIIRDLERLESGDGILALSAYGVQCWLDIDEMGCSLLGVARADRVDFVQRELTRVALDFWNLRQTFCDFPFLSPEEAIREGLACPDQPVVLNEPADNVGAGATGDSTYILEALLTLNVAVPTILTIVDPEAVDVAVRASEAAISVSITDHGGGPPAFESPAPDLEAKLAGLQTPRGWGLFLIEKMVDSMRVTTDGAHHTIELIMFRKDE